MSAIREDRWYKHIWTTLSWCVSVYFLVAFLMSFSPQALKSCTSYLLHITLCLADCSSLTKEHFGLSRSYPVLIPAHVLLTYSCFIVMVPLTDTCNGFVLCLQLSLKSTIPFHQNFKVLLCGGGGGRKMVERKWRWMWRYVVRIQVKRQIDCR